MGAEEEVAPVGGDWTGPSEPSTSLSRLTAENAEACAGSVGPSVVPYTRAADSIPGQGTQESQPVSV